MSPTPASLQPREASLEPGDVIAIIDDDRATRIRLARKVKRWGFESLPIEGSFETVPDLIEKVKSYNPRLVLCDNRLQDTGFASFFGAEAVSEFYKLGDPSILITQYQADDESFLRTWRENLPSVLDKDKLELEVVKRAFEKSAAEVIFRQQVPERRLFRTFVRVLEVGENHVTFSIPDWNPDAQVRVPKDVLGQLKNSVTRGSFLIAKVNLGAKESADIFFKDFELAPELNPEDGLG
ncbi:MAG: hypothetical protein ACPGOV_13795 [Magnetovibrionaceae bacterium]